MIPVVLIDENAEGDKRKTRKIEWQEAKELSFNKFPISVHPELVEGSCHRTSTSSVRTESGNENREVISRQLLSSARSINLAALINDIRLPWEGLMKPVTSGLAVQ